MIADIVDETDPRASRRSARTAELLDAAWAMAREEGIAAVTLRGIARRVGLRQPSLYAYIDSKADLYDLMFAQAARQLCDDVMGARRPAEPRAALEAVTGSVVRWVAADPARAQLLFQRVVPGFAPSPASYAHAVRFLDWTRGLLRDVGLDAESDLDLYTALVAGLSLQQTANDPGGERWVSRTTEAVGMLLAHLGRERPRP